MQAVLSKDYNPSAAAENRTFLNKYSASLRGVLNLAQVPIDERLSQELVDDGEHLFAEVNAHSQQRMLLQSENQDMQQQLHMESLAAATANTIATHKAAEGQMEVARSKLRHETDVQAQLEMLLEESKQKEDSALELVEHQRNDEEDAEVDVLSHRTADRKKQQEYQTAKEEAKALSKHLHELENDATESEKQAKQLSIMENELFESGVQKMAELRRLHPKEIANRTNARGNISHRDIAAIMTEESATVSNMSSAAIGIDGTKSANLQGATANNMTAGKQQVSHSVAPHILTSIHEGRGDGAGL